MKIKQNWLRILIFVVCAATVISLVLLFFPVLWKVFLYLIHLFLPFIFGYLFSVCINPLANLLQRKLKCPRGVSAVIVIILTVGILGGLCTSIIWKFVEEMQKLYHNYAAISSSAKAGWGEFSAKLSGIYSNLPPNIQSSVSGLGSSLSDQIAGFINSRSAPLVSGVTGTTKALPGMIISVIVFILSTYFMVVYHAQVSEYVHKAFGKKFSDRFNLVKTESKKYLWSYIRAQLILMLISFVIMFIAFLILSIDYAMIIAFLTAFIDVLPFFGSGIVLIPWAIYQFVMGNFVLGIWLVIIYVILFLVRRFLEPKLVSSQIGINPIPVLMSMYVGWKLGKVWGMIFGPVVLMLIISFYKAGVFDGLIGAMKHIWKFIKLQCRMFIIFMRDVTEDRSAEAVKVKIEKENNTEENTDEENKEGVE